MKAKRVLLAFAVLVVLAQLYGIYVDFNEDKGFLAHYPEQLPSETQLTKNQY